MGVDIDIAINSIAIVVLAVAIIVLTNKVRKLERKIEGPKS